MSDTHVSSEPGAQTTDATPTVVATYTPGDNTAVQIHTTVTARRTGGTEAAGYEIVGVFRRSGAATVQVGSTTVLSTIEDTVGWDAYFAISGADVDVVVVGEAAKTIDWKCRSSVFEVP